MEEVDIESIEFTEEEVEMYDLQVKDNHNFILENDIITHNSGKTYLLRGMIDRLKQCPVDWQPLGGKKTQHDVGYCCFMPSDIKNEFRSSKRAVQGKFRHKLLPGETPIGMKIITTRPTFFREFNSQLPEENLWMSVDISEMQKSDFMTLLRGDQLTEAQQTMLEILYEKLKKKPEFKLSDIPILINELGADFKPSQLQALQNKFKPLLASDFGNPTYVRNLKKVFEKDYALALNMESFDAFGNGGIAYPQVVIGMTLRNIIHMRRQGEIKPLFVFVDEAARFVPNDGNPSCKHIILESVDIDRRFNISYIFATQSLHDMPEKLVMQSRYIFLPFNIDTTIIKEAISSMGLAANSTVQSIPNQANRLKKAMGKWQWLVLDRNRMRYDIITPLSPLSEHLETR